MQKLVAVAGLTACGKSRLAVELALKYGGEVISADSMQVYKHMDIGTAKITKDEMKDVRHHLIDIIEPDGEWSAASFAREARFAVSAAASAGSLPILCGGTGFYINALIYGNDFPEAETNWEYRKKLYETAKNHGNAALHDILREIDPVSAGIIHENNIKRVIRSLEFHEQTGLKMSEHNMFERTRGLVYNVCMIVLTMERQELCGRINDRVDAMFERGLVSEVERLLENGYGPELTSMQGIGYKETAEYIRGGCTISETKEKIKLATRHYAKRQLTWFRHQSENAHILDVTDLREEEISAKAETIINRFLL